MLTRSTDALPRLDDERFAPASLEFPDLRILPGAQGLLRDTARAVLRPYALVFGQARECWVTTLLLGQHNMLTGPISVVAFNRCHPILWPTLQEGELVSIVVENRSAEPQDVRGVGLYGLTLL